MKQGLKRLREDNFPLSLRLIREMHAKLLERGRGSEWMPGEFRKEQNRIGGSWPGDATYVPPPPDHVATKLAEWEAFLHAEEPALPILVRAALAHVQFESIHPFLDGNGRMGRLIIAFLLCARGVVREPILYPSLYLKQHRERYFELLQGVRLDGDWEAWVEFFLAGVEQTANQAVDAARQIQQLHEQDRTKLTALGRSGRSALHIHAVVERDPVFSVPYAARVAHLSYPAARRAITQMEQLGIVQRLVEFQGTQYFNYPRYMAILSQGTEPLPR